MFEYPASLVVEMLNSIKRQMSRGIRIGEMYFAGPVPDEGHYPTKLEGKLAGLRFVCREIRRVKDRDE